ncbi:MAG: LptA/OstA family protein [Armatimonadota bacterium]|nr:LptA/OstA family protein [Armatimonadota bacterium]
MRGLRALLWMPIACLMAVPAMAQEAEPEEPGGIAEDEDRARIEWADELRYDADQATYHLSGNVVFSHQDIRLYCDRAVYDYDANSAEATGSPRVESPDTTMTGELIEANFDDEVAVVTGTVTVVTQRKKEEEEGQDDEQQPSESEQQPSESEETEEDEEGEPRKLEDYWEKKTTITCEKIVYEYAEDVKRATATGRVKAVQEDKTVYADRAVYEELKDLITLTGDVRVLTDRGDEFRCPKAVISVEEDWVRAEQVTGVGKRREEEEEEESSEGAAAQEEQQEPAEGGGAQEQPPEGGEESQGSEESGEG